MNTFSRFLVVVFRLCILFTLFIAFFQPNCNNSTVIICLLAVICFELELVQVNLKKGDKDDD